MDKFKISSKIVAILIVFIIIVGGMTFYEIPIFNKPIDMIIENNKGKVWLLSTLVVLVSSLVGYIIIMSLDVMKGLSKINDQKNDIITSQNDQIIMTLTENGKTHNLLMEKINENTENDLETNRQVAKIERVVLNHDADIKRNKERIIKLEKKIK